MSPEDWKKLQTAFADAIAIEDAAARAACVDRLAADDPALASELQRMLDADLTDDEELVAPVQAVAESLGESAPDRWIGKTLGNYQVRRRIAVGGMSAVYFGKRIDAEFEQDVAIKIVASSLLSDSLNTRFRTERQILATLRHPYIAQLYDGGTTEDGMPYLVMEYIDGLPIDEYCDTNKLNIEARLKLFMQVCKAVDFAHRNLIVHRDIKPSNILVTADGVPKLLDFGIAKLLDTAQVSRTMAVTHANVRAMTPEYASPEQVRGEPITTATDVYSLGVLLFRLLSGRMPYLLNATGLDNLARAIIETQPSRPSTVIASSDDDSAPAIVAQRSTSLSGLRKTLSGDLDNITLATLHKEPDRRYPSAHALADDIARYLAREPVKARPDSLAYRARKFVSRNRVGVAAAGIVSVVIVGLVSFYTWQLTVERNRAGMEARKATQVVEFLSGIFRSASPYYTQGEDMSVRDVLTRGSERIESELAEHPEILAELTLRLGSIHHDLGDYAEAGPLLERSLELRRELYGEFHPSVVPALTAIGRTKLDTDELELALQLGNDALAIARTAEPAEPALVASAWQLISNAYYNMENNPGALEATRNALAIYETLRPEMDREYASVLHNLASAYLASGENDLALTAAEDAFELELAMYGRFHPFVANAYALQSSIQKTLGNLAESEALAREAVNIKERLFGRQHPEFAVSTFRLAEVISSSQRWDEVETLADEALAVFENSFGPDHFWSSTTRGMLAEVYSETGRTEEALRLAKDTLDSAIASRGELGWSTAIAYAEYADALLEAYHDDDAIAAYRNSIAAFVAQQGDLAAAYTKAKLGRALLMNGDVAAAEREIDAALAYCRAEVSPEHSILARTLVAHGELALEQKDFAKASESAEESLRIMTATGQDTSTWYRMAETVLAAAMAGEGRVDEARTRLRVVIASLARGNGTRSRAEVTARLLLQDIE